LDFNKRVLIIKRFKNVVFPVYGVVKWTTEREFLKGKNFMLEM